MDGDDMDILTSSSWGDENGNCSKMDMSLIFDPDEVEVDNSSDCLGLENIISGSSTTSTNFGVSNSSSLNGRHIGITKAIRKLDSDTSSAIRKCQIITKVSDVVRELVENSADAGANSIQVLLDNFGLNKIEVRDTGHGISPTEVSTAAGGGYSSKLNDTNHLSCQNQYGFRGEALSAICSVGNVTITTKTSDSMATKYGLNNKGNIISESVTAYGKGTIVSVENLFSNIPVRRRWIQEKSKCSADLKDIETFLKCTAIANPQIHISFYHNSSLIWNKASVSSLEQALITVLGYTVSKNLTKCEAAIDVPDDVESRHIEAFFLKKPIDMKTMSYTSNKYTLFFVNRKRVFIREFEKMLQQYTAATIEKPAPADRRRFPVAVVNIQLPSKDVDFNREMDKSKVFLVYKERVGAKFEELLQSFYGISSLDRENNGAVTSIQENADCEDREELSMFFDTDSAKMSSESMKENIPAPSSNIQNYSAETRKNAVESFLANISTVSTKNFTQSPHKGYLPFPSSIRSPLKNVDRAVPSTLKDSEKSALDNLESSNLVQLGKSNFDLHFDELLMDTPPDDAMGQPNVGNTKNEVEPQVVSVNEWVHGRLPGSHGSIMQSVQIVNQDVPEPMVSNTLNPDNFAPKSRNAFDLIGAGFGTSSNDDTMGGVQKRAKLQLKSSDTTFRSNASQIQLGIKLSSNGKQVTLDQYNWNPPSKRKSDSSTNEVLQSDSTPGSHRPTSSSTKKSSSSSRRLNCSNSRNIPEGPRISVTNYWNKYGIQSNAPNNGQQKSALSISTSSNTNSQINSGVNVGSLIGALSDSTFYAAQINGNLGIFHPMNMLLEFPSLKYDLKISLVKTVQTTQELGAEYIVASDGVQKLFNEFLRIGAYASGKYPKIFHEIRNIDELFESGLQSQVTSWHQSQRPATTLLSPAPPPVTQTLQ